MAAADSMSEIVLEIEDLHTYIGQHHILQGVSLRVKRDAVTVLLGAKWQSPASELAHGEKRKLEVGILLALDAEVLLLDEPTAGMSLEEVPSIIALVEGIRRRRDRTVLLVEHKIDMIMALSDSIAVLKDGRLIADDTTEAVSTNPEVQAAYFGGGGGAR